MSADYIMVGGFLGAGQDDRDAAAGRAPDRAAAGASG